MDLSTQGFDRGTEDEVRSGRRDQIFEKRIAHEWLTTGNAAEYLGISENALRIMVYRNQVRSHKLGRRLRFRANDLKALFVKKGV